MIKEIQALEKHQKEWEKLYALIPALKSVASMDRAIHERRSTLAMLDRKIEKTQQVKDANEQGCRDKLATHKAEISEASTKAKEIIAEATKSAESTLKAAHAETKALMEKNNEYQNRWIEEVRDLEAQKAEVGRRFKKEEKKLLDVQDKIRKLKASI
jgi:cell division septum initiation protein DivIVA